MTDPVPKKFKRALTIQFEEIAKACKGKSEPSKAEMLDWVLNHVGLDPTKIEHAEFPSVGAANMLLFANKYFSKFLIIWQKLIPTQTQIKVNERPKDDGQVLDLLDSLEQPNADSAAGVQGQPRLQEEDSGVGPGEPDSA